VHGELDRAGVAQTGGYRLALLVASALVQAALAVTIRVLRPAGKPAEADPAMPEPAVATR